jgi:uncharacterized protein YndB with AHSA1/START domain
MTDRIEKTVDLRAPIERVWRAVTDHVEFGQWFRVALDGPFIVGEVTRGRMTYPGYEHMPWASRVLTMDAPRLFVFQWPHSEEDEAPDDAEIWTTVEFRLEPTASGTRVTIIESGFDALPPGKRETALRSNEGGWEEQTRNIQAHVGG